MTEIKKLNATRADDYKGHAMLEIKDGDKTVGRMSINKALRVVRAAEDVVRLAQEAGLLEDALVQEEEQPVAAVADTDDGEGLFD